MKAEINGVDRVLNKLKFQEQKHPKTVTVLVGYTAKYALSVHEKVEMVLKGQPRRKPSKGFYWDPQGRGTAKYLEIPVREHRSEIAKIVRDVTKATGSLENGLVFAGLFIQAKSQAIVPIETGNLKASAFTSLIKHDGSETKMG